MTHAPGFDGAAAFPSPSDDLAPVAHGALGPALFARASGDLPFDAWMGPLRARLGWLPFDALRPVPDASKDWTLDASWALYCDNYLEGMHVPFVHPALSRALDLSAYCTELLPWGTLQIGFAKQGDLAPAFEPPPGAPDHGRRVAAYWAWLFPGTMLNFYPWGLSVNVVTPIAVRRTVVRYFSFAWDLSLGGRGAGGDLDRVEREDQSVALEVQAGLASRAYSRGRYAPLHEQGVHYFHRLLARAMFGA
jgi:choline monooxygenase